MARTGTGAGGLQPDRAARNRHSAEGRGKIWRRGILTALLLHLPIGIRYVKAVGQGGAISRADWAKGAAGAVGSAVFGVAVPNLVMRDPNSPYAFTPKQMGPCDV
jgi:hypothetical protein